MTENDKAQQQTVMSVHGKYIGRRALLTVLDHPGIKRPNGVDPASTGIQVPVHIVDVRFVFGRTDALVVPFRGRGNAWVNLESLVILGAGQGWPPEKTNWPIRDAQRFAQEAADAEIEGHE